MKKLNALPYVYIVQHSISKEFYIGYRSANKKPAIEDLPRYKTSSKIVKPIFSEFKIVEIIEFDKWEEAYDHEQKLILDNWDNPLLLNKSVFLPEQKRFKGKTSSGQKLSASTKQAISQSISEWHKTNEKVGWKVYNEKRKLKFVEVDGIVYNSVKEAASQLNVKEHVIRNWLARGKANYV